MIRSLSANVRPAAINLTAKMQEAAADTPEKVVDHLARRFLSVTLAEKDRAVLVEFVRGRPRTEDSLRELLYLVLSMPEYQLG